VYSPLPAVPRYPLNLVSASFYDFCKCGVVSTYLYDRTSRISFRRSIPLVPSPMPASPPPPPYSELPAPTPEQPLASSSHPRDSPLTLHVGLHELHDPLVQIKHLRLHLLFLGALHDLRRRVENEGSWPPLIGGLDRDQRWSWFINLAVERRVLYALDRRSISAHIHPEGDQISALGRMSFTALEIEHVREIRSK
jgi:hypothetical protein